MITTVAVAGYRSLRDIVVPLAPLTVVTGGNGSGKSSLYRALRLLAASGSGRLVRDVAASGGLAALRWAGPETLSREMRSGNEPVQGTRRSGPVRLLLGFASDELGYAVDLGLPTLSEAGRFPHDATIKAELIFAGEVARPAAVLLDRAGPRVRQREGRGWDTLPQLIGHGESVLTELVDARTAPEVVSLRRTLARWRFHDQVRTDPAAPARQAQVATRSPVLDDDGGNLAATLATIQEVGAWDVLAEAVAEGLQDSRVEVRDVAVGGSTGYEGVGTLELVLHQPGLLRPVRAAELSDGTLHFLLLAAALLSPRPPELLVLNEPEASLHPDLLPALARLITRATASTQVVVVTHAPQLATALTDDGAGRVELVKQTGVTRVVGQEGPLDAPPWRWPDR